MQNVITLVGLITAAIGASSAILSAWITTHHSEKMYRLEVFEKRRLDALEKYLCTSAGYALFPSKDTRLTYVSAYSAAFPYFPKNTFPVVPIAAYCLVESESFR